MYLYAQTNIQLYEQLKNSRYTEADIERIHNTYNLAVELFAGRFRANGKSFLAHLVGTASILSANDAAPIVVTAGLLHAAYPQGSFLDPRPGMRSTKRSRVRTAVGPEVENLVAKYATFSWNRSSISSLLAQAEFLDATQRDLVLLRLANELEDHLDLGMAYCQKTKSYLADERGLASLHALAKTLGFTGLADEIVDAIQANALTKIHSSLVTKQRSSYSISQSPMGSTIKPIYRFLHRLRSKVTGLSFS